MGHQATGGCFWIRHDKHSMQYLVLTAYWLANWLASYPSRCLCSRVFHSSGLHYGTQDARKTSLIRIITKSSCFWHTADLVFVCILQATFWQNQYASMLLGATCHVVEFCKGRNLASGESLLASDMSSRSGANSRFNFGSSSKLIKCLD